MIRQYYAVYAPSRRTAIVSVIGESNEEFATTAVAQFIYRETGWKPEVTPKQDYTNKPNHRLDLSMVRSLRRTGQWPKV